MHRLARVASTRQDRHPMRTLMSAQPRARRVGTPRWAWPRPSCRLTLWKMAGTGTNSPRRCHHCRSRPQDARHATCRPEGDLSVSSGRHPQADSDRTRPPGTPARQHDYLARPEGGVTRPPPWTQRPGGSGRDAISRSPAGPSPAPDSPRLHPFHRARARFAGRHRRSVEDYSSANVVVPASPEVADARPSWLRPEGFTLRRRADRPDLQEGRRPRRTVREEP